MINKTSPLMLTAALLLLVQRPLMAVETNGNMPECALSSLIGKENVNLSQYRGKVTYVDFWASWCGPCAKSFPFMNEMSRQLKNKGLNIIGVNLDENPNDARDFLAKYPAEFTVLADPSEEKKCARDFEVKAMPSTYIIDKDGKIHHVQLGFKPDEAEKLKALAEKLLAEK